MKPKLRFKEFTDEWEEKKLGDIGKISTGRSKFIKNTGGIFPVLGSTGIISYDNDFDYDGIFILVARVGHYAGNIYHFSGKCKISDNTIFLMTSISTKDFLYNSLVNKKLSNLSFGSGQPLIKQLELKLMKIFLPSLPEQEKIGKFFCLLDQRIEKQERKVELLEKEKKGYMQKLFKQELRFKDEQGNDYPAWKEKKLGEIAEYENGKAHENYVDEQGGYILVNSKFISTEGRVHKKVNIAEKLLNYDDITMVLSDVPNGKALAKTFYVEKDNMYTLNQRICRIHSEYLCNRFLYFLLNRNRYFLKFDNGVGQTNLSKKEVLNCPIPFPSLPEQEKIANFLSLLDERIEKEQEKLRLMREEKKGYMERMFV